MLYNLPTRTNTTFNKHVQNQTDKKVKLKEFRKEKLLHFLTTLNKLNQPDPDLNSFKVLLGPDAFRKKYLDNSKDKIKAEIIKANIESKILTDVKNVIGYLDDIAKFESIFKQWSLKIEKSTEKNSFFDKIKLRVNQFNTEHIKNKEYCSKNDSWESYRKWIDMNKKMVKALNAQTIFKEIDIDSYNNEFVLDEEIKKNLRRQVEKEIKNTSHHFSWTKAVYNSLSNKRIIDQLNVYADKYKNNLISILLKTNNLGELRIKLIKIIEDLNKKHDVLSKRHKQIISIDSINTNKGLESFKIKAIKWLNDNPKIYEGYFSTSKQFIHEIINENNKSKACIFEDDDIEEFERQIELIKDSNTKNSIRNIFKEFYLSSNIKKAIHLKHRDSNPVEDHDKPFIEITEMIGEPLSWQDLCEGLLDIKCISEAQMELKNILENYIKKNIHSESGYFFKTKTEDTIEIRRLVQYIIKVLYLAKDEQQDEQLLFNLHNDNNEKKLTGINLVLHYLNDKRLKNPLKDYLTVYLDNLKSGKLLYLVSFLVDTPVFNHVLEEKENLYLKSEQNTLTPDEFYQLYWKYLDKYQKACRTGTDLHVALDYLHSACRYLIIAASHDHPSTKDKIISYSGKILLHEIPYLTEREFIARSHQGQTIIDPARTRKHFENVMNVSCPPPKEGQVLIEIDADTLIKAKETNRPICYMYSPDTETAHFYFQDDQLYFQAYGENIKLKINGTILSSAFIINNPDASVDLNSDIKTINNFYLGGQLKQLNYNGDISSDAKVNIDIDGQLNITKDAKLLAKNELSIRTQDLKIEGKLKALNGRLKARGTFYMSDGSYFITEEDLVVDARSLDNVKGDLISKYKKNTAEIHTYHSRIYPVFNKLGYGKGEDCSKGLCYGLNTLHMLYMFDGIEGLEKSKRFYAILAKYEPDTLIQLINSAKRCRIRCIRENKYSITNMVNSLTITDMINRFNTNELIQFIEIKLRLSRDDAFKILDCLVSGKESDQVKPDLIDKLRAHLIQKLLQENIKNDLKELFPDEDVDELLHIQNELEAIHLLHLNIDKHKELFDKQIRKNLFSIQSARACMPLLFSEQLESKGIKQTYMFFGSYDEKELDVLFKTLEQTFSKHQLQDTVTFILSTSRHAFTIGYLPKEKKWLYTDYQPMKCLTREELKKIIVKTSPSFELPSTFITRMFSTRNDTDRINNCLRDLEKDNNWKTIHKKTPLKRLAFEKNLSYQTGIENKQSMKKRLFIEFVSPTLMCFVSLFFIWITSLFGMISLPIFILCPVVVFSAIFIGETLINMFEKSQRDKILELEHSLDKRDNEDNSKVLIDKKLDKDLQVNSHSLVNPIIKCASSIKNNVFTFFKFCHKPEYVLQPSISSNQDTLINACQKIK